MNVFTSDIIRKQINNNSNRSDLIKRLNNIVEQLFKYKNINQLYEANLGFKKFKGKEYDVYGIDIGKPNSLSMSGERLIVSFMKSDQIEIFERTLDTKEEKDDLCMILHFYCKHDSQNKEADKINEEYINRHDIVELKSAFTEEEQYIIDESYNLKSKYQKYVYSDYNEPTVTVLTGDKYKIIDAFVYDTKPTVLTGIAGSGKTEIIIKIIHDIALYSKESKILYVTFSENLKNVVSEKCKIFNFNNVNFESLKSLIRLINNNAGLEFESFDVFKVFLDKYRNDNVNTNFELKKRIIKFVDSHNLYDIYSEIYGTIMGSMLNNWDRKDIDIISKLDYDKLPNDYKLFSDNCIYDLTRLYIEYLNNDNYYSYNSESMNIIRSESKLKFDYVLVDEVQDLTECQIKMLYSLVKNENNILFCGDTNQIINPTFFNLGRIKQMILYSNKTQINPEPLITNFRNSKAVTELINYVNNIRNTKLPKGKAEFIQEEQSKNTSPGNVYNFCGSKLELFDFLSTDAKSAIIVDDKTYTNLEKEGYDTRNIYTVQSSKGLEFENVIVYNILSNRKEIFEDLYFYGKSNDSTLHYNFNLFYVAITRPMSNLIILEEEQMLIYNDIVNNVNSLENVDEVEEINLKADKSASSFYELGIKLIEKGLYQKAKKNFEKGITAENVEFIGKRKFEKMIDICEIYLDNKNDIELAKIFEDKGYYDYALIHYSSINNYDKIALMNLMIDDYIQFDNMIEKYNIDYFELYSENVLYNKKLDLFIENKMNKIIEINKETEIFIDEVNTTIKGLKFFE